MQKTKVSAVSYLNTLPMVYGLKNRAVIEITDLSVDTPAECAKKLASGKVDIGLVPIAAIPDIQNAQIISNYCIGASGPVRSVILASEVELNNISKIILDPNSRTSIMLVKILAREFWQKKFNYIDGKPGFEVSDIKGSTAGVVIGDKVFAIENKYQYCYDLASEWGKFTGLPFVFAAWVANKPIDKKYLDAFNDAILFGISNTKKAVEEHETSVNISKTDLEYYLMNNIDYILDDKKNNAIELYYEKMKKIKSIL
jgi:chorismate dehydratase